MKTKVKIEKSFDAVAFIRKRREDISKEIEGLTPEEEISYFKGKAAKLKKKTVPNKSNDQ